ncbi:MAG: heme d1 biosynthesis radical SAM protein NirJ [Magnetococcales bacterium]|nr:heme d1 biosynthesis radical SAM protein NirJ [Magnetococcales bacterium]
MFRLTQLLNRLINPRAPLGRPPPRGGPVVVWNLIRRCNLDCRHCYSASSDRDFEGELSTEECFGVLEDMKRFGVPAVILSGGEPLLRPDLFDIAKKAKELGFYLGLSSNGTVMDPATADRIADAGFNYVGVSLDGLEAHHDHIRGRTGAFQEALTGIRNCRKVGVRVGLRFTLTRDNGEDLGKILDLMTAESLNRIYLSHWNYAGRGRANRLEDAAHQMTRRAMTHLFETTLDDIENGRDREFVTGNNDADGVFFLQWLREKKPALADKAEAALIRWGGNASGVGIANIDNRGGVHPDIFWWNHHLGNVQERPFSEIWSDESDALLAGLRQRPRPVTGRCGSCRYLNICGGNTRVRAFQVTGDPWSEDPGCYLTDEEIS